MLTTIEEKNKTLRRRGREAKADGEDYFGRPGAYLNMYVHNLHKRNISYCPGDIQSIPQLCVQRVECRPTGK